MSTTPSNARMARAPIFAVAAEAFEQLVHVDLRAVFVRQPGRPKAAGPAALHMVQARRTTT
jgi:hypothetical protein